MHSRVLPRFGRPNHPLDGVPWHFAVHIFGMSQYEGYSNDFYQWEGPLATSTGLTGWIVTSTEAGAGATALTIRDGVQGGVLRITTDSADNDRAQLQLDGSPFRYVSGRRMWCYARLAPQTAADGEIGFGLIEESDTDMVNTFPTEGIFLEKTETGTDFTCHARQSGTSTSGALGATLANDTMLNVGFSVVPSGAIQFYRGTSINNMVNGFNVAVGNANIPDAASDQLTLAVEIQTGDATTRYLDLDWILAVQERALDT